MNKMILKENCCSIRKTKGFHVEHVFCLLPQTVSIKSHGLSWRSKLFAYANVGEGGNAAFDGTRAGSSSSSVSNSQSLLHCDTTKDQTNNAN